MPGTGGGGREEEGIGDRGGEERGLAGVVSHRGGWVETDKINNE